MCNHRWHTGKPDATNHTYEVWHLNCIILAYHDGHMWRTMEGAPLPEVTHYRER